MAALHLAGKLAKESDATLYIAHIARVPTQDMDVPLAFDTNPQWEREAKAKLARVAEQELSSDIKFKIEVVSGLPSVNIIRLADELGVDLIIMATHGRSGLMHFVIGSVTEEVIEATCPVLVIRAQHPDEMKSLSPDVKD